MTKDRALLCKGIYKHVSWCSNTGLHFEESCRMIKEQTYVIVILIYIFGSASISGQVKGKSCGMVVI